MVRDNPMGLRKVLGCSGQEVLFVLCRLDELFMVLTEVGCKNEDLNAKLCLETAQKVPLIDRSY